MAAEALSSVDAESDLDAETRIRAFHVRLPLKVKTALAVQSVLERRSQGDIVEDAIVAYLDRSEAS